MAMTRSELERAVARATGDSRHTIARQGFSLLAPLPDEDPRYCLDCPGCGAEIVLASGGALRLPEFAECARCDVAYPYQPHEIYDDTDLILLAECA
jgi:hypothetical protein